MLPYFLKYFQAGLFETSSFPLVQMIVLILSITVVILTTLDVF